MALATWPYKLEVSSFNTWIKSQFWVNLSLRTRFLAKIVFPFQLRKRVTHRGGITPIKSPLIRVLVPRPSQFYCCFRHYWVSWMLCQKMSSVPQTVWELQRFKVWIVISVCFLHPCSYFFPTPRKLFFLIKTLVLGVKIENGYSA